MPAKPALFLFARDRYLEMEEAWRSERKVCMLTSGGGAIGPVFAGWGGVERAILCMAVVRALRQCLLCLRVVMDVASSHAMLNVNARTAWYPSAETGADLSATCIRAPS
jgi:hypothetical protein